LFELPSGDEFEIESDDVCEFTESVATIVDATATCRLGETVLPESGGPDFNGFPPAAAPVAVKGPELVDE
jgi:hypothetical protein